MIDDKPIGEYDVQELRQQIGYVMQEPVLFSKTIKENIKFGKLNATDEEVYIAAEKSNCIDFIEGAISKDEVGADLDAEIRKLMEQQDYDSNIILEKAL